MPSSTRSVTADSTASSTNGSRVGRPRPSQDLVRVVNELSETSFPSGHVVHYVTFYGFLFYIFFTHLRPGRWRALVLDVLALLVLLIGPSRVYMGAHWPSLCCGELERSVDGALEAGHD